MSFIIRVVIFSVSWCSGSTVSFGLTRGGLNPSETTDRWCKWCARWTENPEVLVQLKVDPQIKIKKYLGWLVKKS